jgi:hypothetical protein
MDFDRPHIWQPQDAIDLQLQLGAVEMPETVTNAIKIRAANFIEAPFDDTDTALVIEIKLQGGKEQGDDRTEDQHTQQQAPTDAGTKDAGSDCPTLLSCLMMRCDFWRVTMPVALRLSAIFDTIVTKYSHANRAPCRWVRVFPAMPPEFRFSSRCNPTMPDSWDQTWPLTCIGRSDREFPVPNIPGPNIPGPTTLQPTGAICHRYHRQPKV